MVNHKCTAGHEIIKTSIKCCHIITLLESNTIIKQSTNYRKILKLIATGEKSGTVLLDACNNIGKNKVKALIIMLKYQVANYHLVTTIQLVKILL